VGKDKLHQLSRLQPVERLTLRLCPATLPGLCLTGATDWELLGLLACVYALTYLKTFDLDSDGIPENSGAPTKL